VVLLLFVLIVLLLDEGWLCIVEPDVLSLPSDVPPLFSVLQPTANMHANAISAINFFILVLSNVASKLLRTNCPLNKAKTSKNSKDHPLFPATSLAKRREGTGNAGNGVVLPVSTF
jgi:hypothetical protein